MPLEFEFYFDLLNRRQSTEQAVLNSASSGGRDRTLAVMLCHTSKPHRACFCSEAARQHPQTLIWTHNPPNWSPLVQWRVWTGCTTNKARLG